MKNYVVENYENYREEDRLTTNNARKIEFITTARILDEYLTGRRQILDCAAGTGIYSFYLADRGHEVTATDITPRHIEVIRKRLEREGRQMETAVMDATDMSAFGDEIFDVVLNMGPFYHLLEQEQRDRCMAESLRVLKRGGLIFTAYIPRYYVFQLAALSDEQYLDEGLARQIINTGVLRHDDEKCFWTDTYYSSASEMEALYERYGVKVRDHFAQDGLTPLFCDQADRWTEDQFQVWCRYHYSVCREKSTLGASNHVVIVGEKR